MWNWTVQNWLALLALVVSVLSYITSWRTALRQKHLDLEKHDAQWGVFIQDSDFLYEGNIDILFTNIVPNSYVQHVWYPHTNQTKRSFAAVYEPDETGIEQGETILLRVNSAKDLSSMPSTIRLEWTNKESKIDIAWHRLTHLFSESERDRKVHYQNVSIAEARADYFSQPNETSSETNHDDHQPVG